MVFSSNVATARRGFRQWKSLYNYASESLALTGLEKSVLAYAKNVQSTNLFSSFGVYELSELAREMKERGITSSWDLTEFDISG
jgi:hypothetical protein